MKTITPSIQQLKMLASIGSQQWLIHSEAIQEYALSALEAGEKSNHEQKADSYYEQFYTLRKAAFIDANGFGNVEIRGALLNRAPSLYEKLGLATKYETIQNETSAMVKAGAKGIIYHVDSPGGTVAGVVEAGEAIMSAGVPTVSFCYGLSCSAAYWLNSSTSGIIATPSAQVGNIGAILSWADCSAFWSGMGIEFKALVSEGADLKSTFHLEPNESQIAFLQESINEAGLAFREQVSKGRALAGADLSDEVWRAGWYSGKKAGDLGLIDGLGGLDAAATLLSNKLNA